MSNHPNILYIFSDQQRYSALGINENSVIQTPHIDQLGAEGMVCDQVFSNHPLCSPYRAMLISGRYAWQNGVIDNEYSLRNDILTLPEVLKNNGYSTAYIGKWHLGYGPYNLKKRYGFDYLAAYNNPDTNTKGYYSNQYFENANGPFSFPEWTPSGETDLAIRYIKNHRQQNPENPFAMFLAWAPPHWPYKSYPIQYSIYDPANIDLPENVPVQMADFAKQEIADYYACCSGLDAQVGRLLATIEQLDLASNTIICYTSDHGDHLSSHGYGKPRDSWMHHSFRASKSTPYEESIHVPFVIRWPDRISAGARSNAFLSTIDLMPSLLGACGIQQPDGLQGQDLSQVWLSAKLPKRQPNFTETTDSVYLQNMANGWPNREEWVGCWRGVRSTEFTYARWYCNERGPWLFDHRQDPLEMENIAQSSAARASVQEMEHRLQNWMTVTQDPFSYGHRGPRGFLDLGQVFTNPELWSSFSTS